MKIAFLLLCHKNSEQINLLVNKLLEINSDVYIHLDLKSKNLRSELVTNERIIILPEQDSYSIQWGGIEMVQATIKLITAVVNSNQKYDYVALLSGQDFPIRPMNEIEKFLSKNYGLNFIDIMTFNSDKYQYPKYKKRYEINYPMWINKNTLCIKILKRLYMLITGGYSYTFPIFRKRKPFDFDLIFGSQWWCLTYECVLFMAKYYNQHPEYIIYFQQSMVPDECFFQTLFLHSPYSKTRKNSLTYINWNNNERSPRVFTEDDLLRLKYVSTEYCFARKFDIKIDSKVLYYFDKN